MQWSQRLKSLAVAASVAMLAAQGAAGGAEAADKIKVAAPHPTIMPSTFIVIGQEFGFFKKHDVDVEVLWTSGGADAQQATINGSVDCAVQTGLGGILAAIAQGAPVIIGGSDMTGASDLVWYSRADKPYKTLADLGAGTTASFSRPGASSETVIKTLITFYKSGARAVPSGSPPETLTQVMSGQIDAGWITAPLPKEFSEGKVRIIARGNDAPQLAAITTRIHAFNASYAQAHPQAVKGFLHAYNEAIDAVYNDPKALARASEMIKVTPEQGRQILNEMFPRSAFTIDKIGDLDASIEQAVANKTLKAPLTDVQKAAIHKTVADFNAK